MYFFGAPKNKSPLWCFIIFGFGAIGEAEGNFRDGFYIPSLQSGQIIATSHDLTPKGSWGREIHLFQGYLGWWNIIIWPGFNERGMPCILEYLAAFNCFNFRHHQDVITLEESNISHPWGKEHHLQRVLFFEGICYFPGGYVFLYFLFVWGGRFNCFNESFVKNENSQSTEHSSCPSGICSGSSIRCHDQYVYNKEI